MESNKSRASKDNEYEGEEYNKLLAHAKSYLPFLITVINSDSLGIQPQHLEKLRALYEMVDTKRLSTSKLKSCQSVFCNLYSKYHKVLTKDQIKMINSSKNLVQSNEDKNKTKSLDTKSASNVSDQKPHRKSDLPESSTYNDRLNSSDHNFKSHNKSTTLVLENINDDKSLCNDNSTLSSNDLPEFSDSRLRLNKVIGFAVNASIEKLNVSEDNTTVSHTEFAQQIYDDLIIQNKNIFCKSMLNGINMDDIDVDHVKKVVESIKNISVNSEESKPSPPAIVMISGLSKVSVESKSDLLNPKDRVLLKLSDQPKVVSNQTTSIRDRLNNEINVLHKIGSLSEPKQKCISSLKPGTLLDLENSKEISSSLHMESLRPVVKSSEILKPVVKLGEKSTDFKPSSVTELNIRDPRLKKNLMLNPEKSINPKQPSLQRQNTQPPLPVSTVQIGSIPSHLSQSPSSITNPVYNSQFSMEANVNLVLTQCNKSKSFQNDYNQHNHSDHSFDSQKNSNSQYSNLYLTNSNSIHCDDHFSISKRDPRSKCDQKLPENQFRNYKEFREAKYGKEKNLIKNTAKHDRFRNPVFNNQQSKSIDKTKIDSKNSLPFNDFQTINNAASIKRFKIPKIKSKDLMPKEIKPNLPKNDIDCKDIDKLQPLTTESIKDNFNEKPNKPSETNKSVGERGQTETVENNANTNINTIPDLKTDTNQIKDETSLTGSDNATVNDDNILELEQTSILTKSINPSKPKKPKKYTKEKEFEKIVKEAVESLISGNDNYGPRTRTRNSLKKQDKTLKNCDVNVSAQNDVMTKKESSSVGEQCETVISLNPESCCSSTENISGLIETGQNVITSTSKEPSETVVASNTKIQEQSIVSSNEINSTADVTSNDDINKLLLENSPLITLLRDKAKVKKLTELLESAQVVKLIEDKSNDEALSNEENTEIEGQKKSGKKIKKKGKKKHKKTKINIPSEEFLNEKELVGYPSVDSLTSYSEGNTTEDNSYIDDSYSSYNNCSENNSDHSTTNQVKSKSNKRKKYSSPYGNFEIKPTPKHELKDIKIVLSKYDTSPKSSDNPNSIGSNNVPTTNEPKKKTFSGPLSIKISRQKLENEQNCSKPSKCRPRFEIINEFSSKNEDKTKVNDVGDESCTQDPDESNSVNKGSEKNQLQDVLEPSSSKPIENDIDFRSDSKKSRPKITELDKLHADISEMYDCAALLNVPNVRHCRTNKQIDYASSNTVISKKSKASSGEQLKLNDVLIRRAEKCDKKLSKQPKNKFKKTKQLGKNPSTKDADDTAVISQNCNDIQTANRNSQKSKRSKNQEEETEKSQLGIAVHEPFDDVIVIDDNENEFKDISYFQTADNVLQCKFCCYSDTGLNIVRHYKENHCKEEVLPSRLPKTRAELLLSESLRENYGYLASEDYKTPSCVLSNVYFTCVFCEIVLYGIIQFFDHITDHTGEYRYKCKLCEKIYSSINELKNHIIEHPNYDTTNGVPQLLYQNPTQGFKLFGYLCSFCYYVQLDYNNIVKHMKLRHVDEDKQYNGHWTVIRINMSLLDMNCEDTVSTNIDYKNVIGCLPPLKHLKIDLPCKQKLILKKDVHKPTVAELIVETKKKLLVDTEFIKKEVYGQQETIKHLPKTTNVLPTLVNSSNKHESVLNTDQPRSQIDNLNNKLEKNITQSKCVRSNVLPSTSTHLNLSNEDTSATMPVESYHVFKNVNYTFKGNTKQCTVANISCGFFDSVLLFKCHVSGCLDNPYSTVILFDFFKHVERNHRHIIWDRKCSECGVKLEKVSEDCSIEDALKHLVSHHLVVKNNDQPNLVDSNKKKKPCLSTLSQSTAINTEEKHKRSKIQVAQFAKYPIEPKSMLVVPKEPSVINSNDENIDKTIINNLSSDTMVENVEQLSHTSHQNHSESLLNQTSVNQVSSCDSFPQIVDVKSLREEPVIEVNLDSSNKDTNTCLRVNTHLEVKQRDFEICLPDGQGIVNSGEPINNTCWIIDTDYKKSYLKKIKDMPLSTIKTDLAYHSMTSMPRLFGSFKCMDRCCSQIFMNKDSFKLHMNLHYSNTDEKKKNQKFCIDQYKKCAYCYRIFDDPESLADHISDNYSFCNYFCPYCFYRAYTPTHVLVHLYQIHNGIEIKVLKRDLINVDKTTKEKLLAVDYNTFVLPYVCNIGSCNFSCYLHDEFYNHISQDHQNCDKFCCYICDKSDNASERFFAFQPTLMMKHFKLHDINKYQCIFCLFGTEVIDSMLIHLAMEHFEYEPFCLERSPKIGVLDTKNIKNLKIISINIKLEDGVLESVDISPNADFPYESLAKRNKKRALKKCPDVLSKAMKSAHIDENTHSDTIVITVPDKEQMSCGTSAPLDIDNDFIMLDDVNKNDVHEALKLTDKKLSKGKKDSREQQQSSPSNVIIIDDEDDLMDNSSNNKEQTIDNLTKQKQSISNSVEDPNKVKRLANPLIPLDKLFFCKQCSISFSESSDYLSHMGQCQYLHFNGRQCAFCVKSFKTDLNLVEHLKLHGPDRFKCSSCNFNAPSKRAIIHHMKLNHKIVHLDFVPILPDLNNLERDEFVVYEDKTVEIKPKNLFTCEACSFKGSNKSAIALHMKSLHCVDQYEIHVLADPTSNNNFTQEYLVKPILPEIRTIKRKLSIDHSCIAANKKKINNALTSNLKNSSSGLNTASMLFSPCKIESIPMRHIFQEPIGCELCSYNTKVRSNLILHLNGHIKGQDNTTKEIVNPVPSIGKSELMFDKMINLSASSFEAMNTEKMKIDEINKKIVEVAAQDQFIVKSYPQFIPKNKRFKCSMANCSYTGITEDLLKTHISILHPTHECYICPHCPPDFLDRVVDLDKIEFHLMHHGENLYGCQYCDYIDFNRNEMKVHMRNYHLFQISSTNQSIIFVIRQTILDDYIIDRSKRKDNCKDAQWICNLCSTGIKYTRDDMNSHIYIVHKLSKMFKCPMCQFEHDEGSSKIFEDHYRVEHPSVAVKFLTVFEKVVDVKESSKHIQYSLSTENTQEQQALESIEPTLVPPTCRGIPVELVATSKTPLNKLRGLSKSPKAVNKSSPARKQKILIDNFSVNDILGQLSPNGLFSCPRCNVFETMNIEHFREHLFKDVNYKTWQCLNCCEISDSPKKMAWHVKKHGEGTKYKKIENSDKLFWVENVIKHQLSLLNKFKKKTKERNGRIVEQNKPETCTNVFGFSLQKKKVNANMEEVLSSKATLQPNDIIDLVDDSDDE